ncbi:MAG: imidazoleglycerol-phosphate dehydratase [Desulfovibrionales bacterium]|nr:imidazoleglycerol-phosphate dehydratase [Desulfovibrionales bacterium]
MSERKAVIQRTSKETSITLELNLDGSGQTSISTGYAFLDHMLTLWAFWAGFDLSVTCAGDLDVDAHHSAEDVGLCLGQAIQEALGDRAGVERVGAAKVPMDEALGEAVVDLSGRPYLVYQGDTMLPPVIAGEERDLWREFFKSVAFKAGVNLHILLHYGQNGHHLLEAAFKAFGLAMRRAVFVGRQGVSSTKGRLD